jgi:hypothetical protein
VAWHFVVDGRSGGYGRRPAGVRFFRVRDRYRPDESMKDLLPGAWPFVSVIAESDSGGKTEPFGMDPKGIIIFTKDGHFSLFQSRAEVPRVAANDRSKATAEEATGIIASSIAYYGTSPRSPQTSFGSPIPERQLVLRCKLCGEGRKHSKSAIENASAVGNRHRPARHPRAGIEPPR